MRTWRSTCFSACVRPLCRRCRPRRCWSWPRPIWSTTTRSSTISRDRFKAGDLAQIDLDRIELLRVQYESEIQTAIVNLRTSKIALQQLLNDRTPLDQFDVTGPFDFSERSEAGRTTSSRWRSMRGPTCAPRSSRIEQAKTNHKLAVSNGSTDPTFSAWYTYNPSFNKSRRTPDAGSQREYSVAHLRSQPGREAAHADRHRPQSDS